MPWFQSPSTWYYGYTVFNLSFQVHGGFTLNTKWWVQKTYALMASHVVKWKTFRLEKKMDTLMPENAF